MSGLEFRLKSPPPQRVDLSPLTPDRLRDRSAAEIARIELTSGNRRLAAGELFEITPGDPGEIGIRESCDRLDFIGRDMTAGTIAVDGDVGAYAGQFMRGGRLRVSGRAGPWAAAGLMGGAVELGAAGDDLVGALPGDMRGMGGGVVLVHGNVGDRAGDRMRRGVIVVSGDAGAFAGSRIIAGTLVVGGAVGACPGYGMKRGTLLLRTPPRDALPTFADCGSHDLGFVPVLVRWLRAQGAPAAMLAGLSGRARRLVGDLAIDGQGEILLSGS